VKRRGGRCFGAIAVVVVGCVFFLTFAVRGVVRTKDLLGASERRTLDLMDDSFRCLDQTLQQRIPDHAVVFFEAPEGHGWDQRAIEGSFPRYRVVAVKGRADYVVSVRASAPGCDGVHTTIVRSR